MLVKYFLGLTVWSVACQSTAISPFSAGLPIVDLGYELHQALKYDEMTDIYTFSNIRYAQQPIGDLRFRAPLPPLKNRTVVQNGTGIRVCPQGIPEWQGKASQAITQFSNLTVPFNLTKWEETIEKGNAAIFDVNAVSSEDCLFLDVYVPGKFINHRERSSNFEVPVLVEIHGGGYVLGSKTGYPNGNFDPAGLLQHSNDGFIYVALNYRLGALGFLAGSQVQNDGALNAGILDQRLALKWVQKNIHLFGGSPRRVTAIGESGGGGSILVHLNQEKAPFAQIISQSPAVSATLNQATDAFSDFMAILNVSSLSEARKLSSDIIIAANAKQIGAAPPTTYIFGPVQDNHTLPIPVLRALKEGQFDQSVQVMVSHNSLEGGFFFDPTVKTEADFKSWLFRSIPGLNSSQIDNLMNDLYPAAFDGSRGYVDQDTRQMSLWGEAIFNCNFLYVNKAKNGSSYAYEFSISPGIHTQDLTYTFAGPIMYPQVRATLQQVIASFVVSGVPETIIDGKMERFPQWGSSGTLVNLTSTGAKISASRVNETRCAWWAGL